MPQAPPRPEIRRAIEALQRLAEGFALRRRQLAAAAGLTEAEWRVLDEIAGEDFMPSMFARQRDCSPAAISRSLRGLQQKRLVDASISRGDARQREYRLTRKGRDALRRLERERRRAIEAVWREFEARDLDAFVRFADALGDRLESYAEQRRSA
jgi:DNA-binding MarR family transcriptional regulator